MSLIKLTDSTIDAITKMSKGNPGAATAMLAMMESKAELAGIHYVLLLDTFGIYGTDIYVLWSDICGKDADKMISVLSATQRGKFSSSVLKDACSRQDYSGRDMVPVDSLHEQMTVKETPPAG